MGKFVKGDVVVIPFPFSDLSQNKRRPALIISDTMGEDIILCQITSQYSPKDKFSILLDEKNFAHGSLPVVSYIRPNRIFTAHKKNILNKKGQISDELYKQLVKSIISIISSV